jgi:hypothetical protein
MNTVLYNDFLLAWYEYQRENPAQRAGQSAVNTIRMNPDKFPQIPEPFENLYPDPFNFDSKLPAFLSYYLDVCDLAEGLTR